ncbi:MAG: InlB B-repeat-containing protein [Dysgonamonadaceae bacterium]|nr:InlB B-repeat-containing protein [Dysgonamonadaceae bacterium]
MKKIFLTMTALIMLSAIGAQAQVTIGDLKDPESFSILELDGKGERGLRLPQLSNVDKTNAFGAGNTVLIAAGIEAMGLQIFNTTIKCVETWNGTEWITKCAPIIVTYKANEGSGSDILVETESNYVAGNSYTVADNTFTRPNYYFSGWNTQPGGGGTSYAPGASINLGADLTLYARWIVIPAPSATTPLANTYVGAFWKNNQTGERLIRIPVGNSADNLGNWSAVVVDGDFIKMDTSPTTDNGVNWDAPATPDDMNTADALHQVSGTATAVSGTVAANGTIYFRIGLTSAIPTGSAPRYGRILLSYNNNNKQQYLYIRQGENDDYVFRPEDAMNGGSNTVSGNRDLAAKFSPYNLTASTLTDGSTYVQIATGGGEFVKYPTQAGAFFQWAAISGYERRAYHPATTTSLSSDWSDVNATGRWTGTNPLNSTHETCPSGWRRPTAGRTDDTSMPLASESELMQSLFSTTFNGSNSNNGNYRYCGYYADGYFDRRQIVNAVGSSAASNSAVSASTKDVAYIGALFVNPATNASLFVPAAGSRNTSNGGLTQAGNQGRYWCSSSNEQAYGWSLYFVYNDKTYQNSSYRSCGFSVRCVADDK